MSPVRKGARGGKKTPSPPASQPPPTVVDLEGREEKELEWTEDPETASTDIENPVPPSTPPVLWYI